MPMAAADALIVTAKRGKKKEASAPSGANASLYRSFSIIRSVE